MSRLRLLTKKKFTKRFWVFVVIFAALGSYLLYQSFASPYNPYNPASETGIATYYDNTSVGGPGHCAAIHYSRGKKLKVTNRKVGDPLYDSSMLCTVSDAGPFGDGRVIDLNTDDFKKLAGSTSVGVLPVRLEIAPEPKSEPEPEPLFGLNCDSKIVENTEAAAVIEQCGLDKKGISTELQSTPESQKNAFEKMIDFTQDIFTSILNIF